MLGITIIVFVAMLVVGGGFGLFHGFRMKWEPPAQNPNRYSSDPDPINPKPLWKLIGGVAVALGLLVLLFSGIRSVPVKSVGVVTSFGHVEGDLTPGFHWELPWKTANILPETVQVNSFGKKDCLDIRIGGQQTACLYATIKWQIRDQAAPALFNNYDTSGRNILATIQNAVVLREFEQVVNQVMGDYNPIYDVAANGTAGNSQFSTFSGLVQAAMRKDIGSQIKVDQVNIPFARYDTATQDRLNTIQQQYAAAAIAQEQIVVNTAQAKANAAIGAPTASQLAQECYSIIQEAMKTGFKGLPPTLSCGNGSAGIVVSGK